MNGNWGLRYDNSVYTCVNYEIQDTFVNYEIWNACAYMYIKTYIWMII